MKIVLMCMAAFVFCGCTTVNSKYSANDGQTRTIAQILNEREDAYNEAFGGKNYFERVVELEATTGKLLNAMPVQGHSKALLVRQFRGDVQKEIEYLKALPGANDSADAWLPASRSPEILASLGRIAQSYKIMSQMGIYLTASGVFEKDATIEDFYLSLLDQATYDIENGLRADMLAYKPEIKEAAERQAKLAYTKSLAVEVRSHLRKVFGAKNSPEYAKLNTVFSMLSSAGTIDMAKRIVAGKDFAYAKTAFQSLNVSPTGDIDGFNEAVDLTIATKFSTEMINQLVTSAR